MEQYNKLEDPTDEENDMLDLAFGLSETLVPCMNAIIFHFVRSIQIIIFFCCYFGHQDLILCLGFCRSRLGCQVIAKPELDGIRLAIPAATRNFAVDGYVPKPH